MAAPPIAVRCLVEADCVLGEGPVWDPQDQVLWWVDIKAPAVHRFDPASGAHDSWPAPERVGALALRRDGGLVLALESGFAFFAPGRPGLVPVANPERDLPGNRMNDAKCDVRGRFWAGSMDDAEVKASGQLYRLDPDGTVARFEAGFVVTNGPDWNGAGDTFYFTDSNRRTIWAYDFDMAAGTPGDRRVFAVVPEADGFPDGLCVDAEDHLWGAHWGGARITRYAPDGSVALSVALPAPLVTSCCFGGPDLDVLYVTTARVGLNAAALAAAPLSGAVFAISGLGVRGRPMPRFAG